MSLTRSIIGDAAIYGLARVVSAGLSFSLFAAVSRYCFDADAKAIYFFTFTFGFLATALRAYTSLSASLSGTLRSTEKLRIVLRVADELRPIRLAACVGAIGLFALHPVSVPLKIVAGLLVALVSFDTDVLQAALNRRPTFAIAFAMGGLLGLAIFLIAPTKSIELGCVALLAQWAPAAALNLYLDRRLWRRRPRQLPRRMAAYMTLFVAFFDGTILNASFLTGDRLNTAAGIDLSIAMRVFVASLPLFPLVLHWSNSKTLGTLAQRLRTSERRLYVAMLATIGIAGGALFTLLFQSSVDAR